LKGAGLIFCPIALVSDYAAQTAWHDAVAAKAEASRTFFEFRKLLFEAVRGLMGSF